jgi:APA family basic amino acid/polyamine antiporter
MYGIGNTIGAGIFALTGIAVQYTGPSLCLSFTMAGLMCLTTAMMYAELCARFPYNGSAFSYVYATFGELAAWIVGWNILPFYGAACSGLARALVSYSLGFLEKFGFKFPKWISNVTVIGIEECCPLAVVYMMIIAVINCLGTEKGSQFNSTLTIAKLVTLIFIILVAFS